MKLEDGKRQTTGPEPASSTADRGEAPTADGAGAEPPAARHAPQSLDSTERLMEEVCERDNMKKALRRVRSNKGQPGVDGMTVDDVVGYLVEHWPTHREQLLSGTYKPQPVRRVEIPKPGGGVRKLGIPTVLDRIVQQAVLQVLQRRWDPTFSDSSFGFRPGRSAHQAVARAQQHAESGHRWVVDIDLEKFFDRVNHDRLMGRVAERVKDKRMLKLIRSFLTAGVMEHGLVTAIDEGTPQGGPLSPLLSNLVLDELDRELERRGHRFVRYADDCNVYVRSERAGQRVMKGLKDFIAGKLKLKVNEAKSAVAQPWDRKFLGFSVGWRRKRRIAPQALDRFQKRVREITDRTRGRSMERVVGELSRYLTGWRGYFGYCQTPTVLANLDSWVRRRLRSLAWKQWKRGRRRYFELSRLGVTPELAAKAASSRLGPWRMSATPALNTALSPAYFNRLRLPLLAARRG